MAHEPSNHEQKSRFTVHTTTSWLKLVGVGKEGWREVCECVCMGWCCFCCCWGVGVVVMVGMNLNKLKTQKPDTVKEGIPGSRRCTQGYNSLTHSIDKIRIPD